jgi:hypothetical protein
MDLVFFLPLNGWMKKGEDMEGSNKCNSFKSKKKEGN